MRKVENVKEGFHFTDGNQLLEITGTLPSRPDTFLANTDSGDEIKIKRDKLYKVKLDEEWLSRLKIKAGEEIFKNDDVSVRVKKSGPSFHLEIQNLKEGSVRRKMVLSVDELQHQLESFSGRIYKATL